MIPFKDIKGPHYVYVIRVWVGTNFVPIYVGRGSTRRAKAYYKTKHMDKYFEPKTHNAGLNTRIAEVRSEGQEIGIHAYECGSDKSASQLLEQKLLRQYGRLDKKNGSLYNRNWGG